MSVRLKNTGFLGRRLQSMGKFYLIAGKFSSLLDNKFNMINAIGHEYRHYLDNLQYKSLKNNGFENKNIQDYSRGQRELRAIQYQRSLYSWQFTTDDFKDNMLRYENKNKSL